MVSSTSNIPLMIFLVSMSNQMGENEVLKQSTTIVLTFFCQIVSQEVNAIFFNKRKITTSVNVQLVRKQDRLIANMDKVFMVWTEDQSHDNIQSNNPQPCTNSLIL
jgi:hypothetical protein